MTTTAIWRDILDGATGWLGRAGTVGLVVFLLLYVGVVLPAVWSARPYRRTAARQVLTALLNALQALVRGTRPR
ncbi:hypothetical protein ABZ923_20650 [Streptomyces sp. NPDC046881]|uniref:hypothetical protein n=1 Tax=Streptomyces sp. NPDC046881 TaxID=3155374 RepID=UPI0033E0F73C